jgi:hypothetical protein
MCFEESLLVVDDMVEIYWCFDDKLVIYVNFLLYLDDNSLFYQLDAQILY